ncbi:poly [ADP-ribose] polymerase tankyrase-1-like [Haliotis asinina]|uniref:poly [ADP-ribose] polymerase tankyrase-1-like n=1 Tax=Haliotis asinina TaxID=109174 RepID=UPI0035323B98
MALSTLLFSTLVWCGVKDYTDARLAGASLADARLATRVRLMEGEIHAWKPTADNVETKLINTFTVLESSLKEKLTGTSVPPLITRLVKQAINDIQNEDYIGNIIRGHVLGDVHSLKAEVQNAESQLNAIRADTYRESPGKLQSKLTKDIRALQLKLNQTADGVRTLKSELNQTIDDRFNTKQRHTGLTGNLMTLNMSCCVMNPGTTRVSTDSSQDPGWGKSVPPKPVTTQDSDSHATAFQAARDLYDASEHGDLERVKRILSAGNVDINARVWGIGTAVMVAAWRGQIDVVKFLVDRGANVSLVDEDGDTILHWACEGGGLETVKLILSLKVVDINSRGVSNKTPMMMAEESGYIDVVKLLVSQGADVSLVDVDGRNILHYASFSGDLETVKLILSLRVLNINARTNDGYTAANIAKEWGRQSVFDFLMSRGAH